LMTAVPILPSLVGYGMTSVLPSGEKSPQQLTGLTGRSFRAPVPLGFAVQTDLLPIEGLTSRSNTIRPFVRVVAPAAPENSTTPMQAVMASPPAATRCRTIGRSYARASSASRAGRWAARVLRNTLRTAVSHHRVHPRRLSEPLCAELRRPLECLEV